MSIWHLVITAFLAASFGVALGWSLRARVAAWHDHERRAGLLRNSAVIWVAFRPPGDLSRSSSFVPSSSVSTHQGANTTKGRSGGRRHG